MTAPTLQTPLAVVAADTAPRVGASSYPEPHATSMKGRTKRPLGDVFGLTNLGVNLTTLAPGAASSLRHAHRLQDEFVYILSGSPTLHTDAGFLRLSPGMCAGFKAGNGNAHRLLNQTEEEVIYLEIGDRTPGDSAVYPDVDLAVRQVDGRWAYTHKDGTPFEERSPGDA